MDDDGIGCAFAVVVLPQFLAEAAGLDADDRVGAGIVVRRPSEDLDADHGLFEGAVTGDTVFHDQFEELAHPRGAVKPRCGQNSTQLITDCSCLKVHFPPGPPLAGPNAACASIAQSSAEKCCGYGEVRKCFLPPYYGISLAEGGMRERHFLERMRHPGRRNPWRMESTMAASLETRKERADYIEKKYGVPWNAAQGKFAAVQAELARVRQKFNVNPPPGLPPKLAADFATLKAESLRILAECDLGLAECKKFSGEISRQFKRS